MQHDTNESDNFSNESYFKIIKNILNKFKAEWKKGKYYMLKNKEENIEKWKNNPKEMALGKLK